MKVISDKNNPWNIKKQIMNYQVKPWDESHVIDPSIIEITLEYMNECLICQDEFFSQIIHKNLALWVILMILTSEHEKKVNKTPCLIRAI